MTKPPPRRRLDPAARRDEILDAAAAMVMADGVSAVSMEAVARAAGISKALVYNYFSSRSTLLSALLRRTVACFEAEGAAAAASAGDFVDLVRATTRAYLAHVATHGVLIQRLLREPAVASTIEADEASRRMTADFFARAITREYGTPPARAATIAAILMGLTGGAGDLLHRTGADVDAVTDLTVAMLLAAIAAVSTRGPA
ncbi:MAG: hypothetical protein CFE37_13980 [Alphaproteobacteria bacterium PA4]|nr:MAG: hypothetical protein CFE37_13980 [Alphaproteobacteria bacterium PA4]